MFICERVGDRQLTLYTIAGRLNNRWSSHLISAAQRNEFSLGRASKALKENCPFQLDALKFTLRGNKKLHTLVSTQKVDFSNKRKHNSVLFTFDPRLKCRRRTFFSGRSFQCDNFLITHDLSIYDFLVSL